LPESLTKPTCTKRKRKRNQTTHIKKRKKREERKEQWISFGLDLLVPWMLSKHLIVANRAYLTKHVKNSMKQDMKSWRCRVQKTFDLKKTLTDLIDAKPFSDTFRMVNMFAHKFCLLIPSFVFHLANYTSVSRQK